MHIPVVGKTGELCAIGLEIFSHRPSQRATVPKRLERNEKMVFKNKYLRWSLNTVIGIIVIFGLTLIVLLSWRNIEQNNVAERRAIGTANGIEITEVASIGGIDQSINIRGKDLDNPVLLFVHGGPGHAMTPFAHSFQDSWEDDFTVVQWDQRNVGKTYFLNDPTEVGKTMSVERMAEDLIEVSQYLIKRLGKKKIFILGHSWGSVIGTMAAKQHPELYHAYIGTGQVISMTEGERLGYEQTLKLARERSNKEAIAELEAIAPYPNQKFDGIEIRSKWIVQFGQSYYGESSLDGPLLSKALYSPDYTLNDLSYFVRRPVPNWFLDAMPDIDLRKLGYDFDIPIIFMIGAHEWQTPYPLVQDYYEQISAPYKNLIFFDKSSHFPFMSDPDNFAKILKEELLPIASKP